MTCPKSTSWQVAEMGLSPKTGCVHRPSSWLGSVQFPEARQEGREEQDQLPWSYTQIQSSPESSSSDEGVEAKGGEATPQSPSATPLATLRPTLPIRQVPTSLLASDTPT